MPKYSPVREETRDEFVFGASKGGLDYDLELFREHYSKCERLTRDEWLTHIEDYRIKPSFECLTQDKPKKGPNDLDSAEMVSVLATLIELANAKLRAAGGTPGWGLLDVDGSDQLGLLCIETGQKFRIKIEEV